MNNNESEKRSIDRGRAVNVASLRAVVAVYLMYLGVSLVRDRLTGTSDMALWLAWLCGIFFVLAGAAFGWFTWKRWRADTAVKPANKEEKQPEEDPPED